MQEQCLSRRLLEFGINQISWKCIAGSASERYPSLENSKLDSFTFNNFSRKAERMLTVLDDQELIGNHNTPSQDFLFQYSGHWIHTWRDIVENYTNRDLTYVSDRAAAISGLTDLISEARRVPVAYGMWIPYLVSDLLWCASVPADGRVAIKTPSWSWFSVGVGVGIMYKLPKSWKSKILDHGAATVSIDKTTSLQRAGAPNQILKITAHLLEVRQSGPLPEETLAGTRYGFQLRDGREQKQGWEYPNGLDEDWDGQWCPDTTFDPNWNVKAIQFIETVDRKYVSRKSTRHIQSMGLMVVPVDEEARVYSRVGWYSIECDLGRGIHKYKTFYKRAKPWKKHWERWLGEKQTIWLV
jgi:hypothetical protein